MKTGDEYQCDRCEEFWINKSESDKGPGSLYVRLERDGVFNLNAEFCQEHLCRKCEERVRSLLTTIRWPDKA